MPMVCILGTRIACVCTYGVGYGVVVLSERQYQSLMCGTAILQSRFFYAPFDVSLPRDQGITRPLEISHIDISTSRKQPNNNI